MSSIHKFNQKQNINITGIQLLLWTLVNWTQAAPKRSNCQITQFWI